MKRTVVAVMLFAIIVSVLSLGACGKKADTTAKLGVGIYKEALTENANGNKNGSLNVVSTVALTLFDENGKIIKCYLDTTLW